MLDRRGGDRDRGPRRSRGGLGNLVRLLQRPVPRRMAAGLRPDAAPKWRADVEPPTTPTNWFDTATGVVFGDVGEHLRERLGRHEGQHHGDEPDARARRSREVHGARASRVEPRAPMSRCRSMFLPVSMRPEGQARRTSPAGIMGRRRLGHEPDHGWVASYSTTGGSVGSARSAAARRPRSEPTGIAIGAHGAVWVKERCAMRPTRDRRLVRTYRAHGNADRQAPDRRDEATAHVGRDRSNFGDGRGRDRLARRRVPDPRRPGLAAGESSESAKRVADLGQQLDLGRAGRFLFLLLERL